MCAITGIVSNNAQNKKEILQKMTEVLAHRGPDSQGKYFFNQCGLGHRRLSIIDLKTGDQPMLSNDLKKALVFNGEIYGYKDIKKELNDYEFKTTSDTEIILALYEKYRDDFVKNLPGMFSFALWDDKEKKLICARDRFGEKPFYYAIGKGGEFIFSSEIKSILVSGLVNPVLDKESLIHYLKRLYIHPNKTIYKNIFTLPPAHILIYKNGKVIAKRYWQMPEIKNSITLEDAVPEFKRLLNKAVEKQLIADVPVGAFLSGGLDSSTIVALASQYKKGIKTFSFAFRDSINELSFAREIAQKYGTDHTELYDDEEDIGELLFKMADIYDEPFADSSNIPTYLISKLARKYTKVALTGDGGDELFGGYGWYKPFLYFKNKEKKSLPQFQLLNFLGRLSARFSFGRQDTHQRLKGAAYSKKFDSFFQAHLHQNEVFNDNQILKLGLKTADYNHDPGWKLLGSLDDAMRLDAENYMPGDILVKIDRASMANSLELRAPFLDIDFASFCLSLPHNLKINREEDKYILRKAFQEAWTPSIQKRNKQGFGAPVSKWLSKKSLIKIRREFLEDKNKKFFNLVSFENSREYVNRNNYRTWALLVLSIWTEKHDFDY